MMKRKVAWLAGVCVAVALQAGAAAAEPALWKVEDKDSTLYLFGTVHLLKPDLQWRDARLNEAFKTAGEVWFEIDTAKAADPAAFAPYQALFLDPARPLSAKLSAEEYARFAATAAELGLPAAQLEPLRPWAVALQFTTIALAKAGVSPQAGVETILSGEVGERPLKTLETLEQQIRIFADMSPEAEKAFLLQTLDDIAEGVEQFDTLAAAWQSGDLAVLETEFVTELREQSPELYDAVLKRRNQAWAAALDAELKGAGSDFVAVGAAHLVGPDGVPKLLRERGYKVTLVPAK